MSFGESVNAGGFIQKTIKNDLIVIFNHVYPRRKQLQKTLEDIKRQPTEADPETMRDKRDRGFSTCRPLFATTVLHRLKD